MKAFERNRSRTVTDMGRLWDMNAVPGVNRASNAPFVPSEADLPIPIGSGMAQMVHCVLSRGAAKRPNGPDVNALEKRDVKGTSGASDTEGDRL